MTEDVILHVETRKRILLAREMMPSPGIRLSLVTQLRGASESTGLSMPQLQHPKKMVGRRGRMPVGGRWNRRIRITSSGRTKPSPVSRQ
ncbi:hypothetical protein AV530_014912 [Patagioenas fasciata monilis]|uniref:Uncharacterized protein n=1 Tax=Patagioenas fasciata monilis TaxID=372326 RepID=A0A1V4K0F7_PATFA|nr:hypothetical protein AV530_014912 [Patagioenas fasciata monilis]